MTRQSATRGRLGALFSVVAVFAVLGPLVGGLAAGVAATAHSFFSGAVSASSAWGIPVALMLVILVAYPVGISFAVITGIIVAVIGIWKRHNGVLVAVLSAAFACAVVAPLTELVPENSYWRGSPNLIGIAPICVVASLVCWWATRDIVRSTWPPVS